jgi:hypothetical protein
MGKKRVFGAMWSRAVDYPGQRIPFSCPFL